MLLLSALRASVKFHALYTKSSIQERLGRHEDAKHTMDAARQTVKAFAEEFKSKTSAR